MPLSNRKFNVSKKTYRRINQTQKPKNYKLGRKKFAEYSLYERFYTLSIDKTVVESGDVFTITLETEKVSVGTLIPYTISGVELDFIDELNSEDDLKGEFTVNESGTTSISFTVSDNITLTELTQFVLTLDNTKDSVSTTFLSYELTVDKTTVNEGDSVLFTLNTYGLEDGSEVSYTIDGSNIIPVDLNVISLKDSFYIVGGSSSVQFFINEDVTTEGDETFTLSLDNGKGSESVNIIDTSREPSYTLSGPSEVNEGDTITINLTTDHVSEGDLIGYTIDGIAASDIAEPLTGSFTIGSDGTAQAVFNVIEDALTEGGETFILRLTGLDGVDEFVEVDIVDTSRTPIYNLDVDNLNVNETDNNEFTVTLISQNVNTGTVVDYTMSGSDITVDDFVGLTSLKGSFVVGTTDSITFTLDSDFKTEGLETITFSLDNGSDSSSIVITDSSVPTYTLSGPSQVNEGDVITINLSTQGVSQGDLIGYSIEGISDIDIEESLTGSFTVGSDGTAQAVFNVIEDRISDGNDPFRLVLDTPSNESYDVNIIDTSKTPGFNLTSTVGDIEVDEVNETLPDNVVVITLETENVAQGEQFGYTINGTGITLDDFIGLTSFIGTFTVDVDGKASVTLTIEEDYITENNETITLSLNNNQASKNIIINDTSVETYEIDVENGIATVNEGDSFKVILTTRGVVDNTQVPYSITGVSSNDIGGINTTGDFTVINNTAEIIFNITEDFSPIDPAFKENLETFNLTLTNTGETVSVDINDTSVQTFVLTTDKEHVNNNVNEGDSVTITLTTQGVADGVNVPYAILGTGILPSDLGISDLSDSFTVNNDTSSVTFNINEDVTTEGSETFTLSLDNGVDDVSVTIADTSKTPVYTLESTHLQINEGQSFTITLNTENVDIGTEIPYTIGGVQSGDINNTSTTGSFTVGSDESRLFLVTLDGLIEGNEDFVITLTDLGVSQTVTIVDVIVAGGNPDAMVLTVDSTLKTDRTFEIFNTNNIVVNWGDNSPEEYFYGENDTQTQYMYHQYPFDGDGTYTVSIVQGPARDTIGMYFGYDGGHEPLETWSADMITEITSWGKMKFKKFEYFLSHAKNITQLPFGDVPVEFNTSEVTDFTYAFLYNRSLVSFPEGFDTSSGEIFNLTWYDCRAITSFPDINISSAIDFNSTWRLSNNIVSFSTNLIENIKNSTTITNLKQTWYNCSSLTSSTFTNFDAPINLTDDGLTGTWQNCSSLTSFPPINIPSGVSELNYTWRACEGLLSFPDSIINQITNSVTLTELNYTWYGCSNLPDGTYDNFDVPQNITTLDGVFGSNSQLTYFPQIDTSNVTSIQSTWVACINLESFPSIDVGKVTKMAQAWSTCPNLSSFGKFLNNEYVTCNYFLAWANTNINITKLDNPFIDLTPGATIPVSSDYLSLWNVFINAYATYIPPFDISQSSNINPVGVDPVITEGCDMVGWENIILHRVNTSTFDEIHMPKLTTDEYDDIITKLHSNISNHTPLDPGETYKANFKHNTYSSSVATKRQDLIDNGWEIIDGGEAPVYTLDSTASVVNEGESFTITLNTENVDNDTVIPYTIGGVQTEDIDNTSLTGSFTVGSDDSRLFLVTDDSLAEGTEDFVITLTGLGVSQTVFIISSDILPMESDTMSIALGVSHNYTDIPIESDTMRIALGISN